MEPKMGKWVENSRLYSTDKNSLTFLRIQFQMVENQQRREIFKFLTHPNVSVLLNRFQITGVKNTNKKILFECHGFFLDSFEKTFTNMSNMIIYMRSTFRKHLRDHSSLSVFRGIIFPDYLFINYVQMTDIRTIFAQIYSKYQTF